MEGTDNYAGAEQIISFKEAAQREAAPNAGIDYPAETLTGLAAGIYTITPTGGTAETVTVAEGGVVSIREPWFGASLSIVANARNDAWSDSLPQSLPIPARPAAPAIRGVNETVDGKHDGSITGLTDGTDYQLSGGSDANWTAAAVTGGAITGLAPGTYLVRTKATGTSFTGRTARVTIGTVDGYGHGRFGPGDALTREQLAVVLWRYAGSPESGETLDRFTDGAETSFWAAAALRWAVEQGIVAGKGRQVLDPLGKASRAEAAAMIQRFFTLCQSV